MTSKEKLEKIVEKYDWLGKEYCRLIGKGDELHKVNQTAFVECLVTPIKQDLERLEELKKENQELMEALKDRDKKNSEIIKQIYKYKKAIGVLKNKRVCLDTFMNCKSLDEYNNAMEYTYKSISENYKLTQQEYELLNEVLEE